MKRAKLVVLAGLTAVFMGMTMPSCPGQQAMQQQIDNTQTSQAELKTKIASLNNQVNTLNSDMAAAKALMQKMTEVIQAQSGSLKQLDDAVKAMQSAPKPAGKKKKK